MRRSLKRARSGNRGWGAAAERITAPSTVKGQTTRRRILEAAEREFGTAGYHRVSVGSIMARADAGVGTFYLYFSSKNDVLRAVVRDLGDRVAAHLQAIRGGSPLHRQQLRLLAYLDFLRAHPRVPRIVSASEAADDGVFNEYYAALVRTLRGTGASGREAIATGLGIEHILQLVRCLEDPGAPMTSAVPLAGAAVAA